MRYYKQSHRFLLALPLATALAVGCLVAALADLGGNHRFELIVCGVTAFAIGWRLHRGRHHVLEIDRTRIRHRGFTGWTLRKAEVTRVEHGRKGLLHEYDPFLTVHAGDRSYPVDDGFLLDQDRVAELVAAMESRDSGGGPHP